MTATPIVLTTVGSFHALIVGRLKSFGATVLVADSVRDASRLYKKATHVLIPGGADIHPSNYNQEVTYANPGYGKRDAIELLLADRAILDRKPLFGICRGHQVIAVAAGGSLHQDIEFDTGVRHGFFKHAVKIEPGTLLHTALGRKRIRVVNSYHHQAVSALPRGWVVSASTYDGIVEGIGHPKLPVISVQWHPEALSDPESIGLFRRWLAL